MKSRTVTMLREAGELGEMLSICLSIAFPIFRS
jgi:hypothetical protein